MPQSRIPLPDLECPAFAAVLLAGGPAPADLAALGSPHRALVPLLDRPTAAYALAALQRCPQVDALAIVGPDALSELAREAGATLVPDKGSMLGNVLAGLEEFPDRAWVILCGADMPLLTVEILNYVLEECAQHEADLYYPIVPQDILEAKYPGGKRTWVHLREGTVTGGNLILVRPQAMLSQQAFFDRLLAARKNPVKLAALFGLPFLFRILTKQLTLAGLEKRAAELLGGTVVKGVVIPHPEVGIDLDKAEDHAQLSRILADKQARQAGFFAPVKEG